MRLVTAGLRQSAILCDPENEDIRLICLVAARCPAGTAPEEREDRKKHEGVDTSTASGARQETHHSRMVYPLLLASAHGMHLG